MTRPLQLAVHERTLLVLGPGERGDAAGEIYRVDLDAERPVDLSRLPRVRIPFLDARLATLGSLALHPRTREIYLGEENGTRLYRLGDDERLILYATGLRRLLGGSSVVLDAKGRLIVAAGESSALNLIRIQRSGRTPITGQEFARSVSFPARFGNSPG